MIFNKINLKRVSALFFCLLIVILSVVAKDNITDMLCGKAVKKLPVYCVDRNDKKISISFDCAWGNEYTTKLLDVMDEYQIKCTFFMVSFWAKKYQDDVKEIIKRGHEIGTHSETHSHMSKLSAEKIDEELKNSKQLIKDITKKEVILFRPPFGEYNNNLIERAELNNLYTIQWDVDSLDWKNISAKEIAKRVISKVKSGSIILCHNNGLHTAESLPLIFSSLKENGYNFVKISDLIYRDNYEMLNDGTQIKITAKQ